MATRFRYDTGTFGNFVIDKTTEQVAAEFPDSSAVFTERGEFDPAALRELGQYLIKLADGARHSQPDEEER